MAIISLLLSLLLTFTSTFLAFDVKADPPTELMKYSCSTIRMFTVLINNVESGDIVAIDGALTTVIGHVVKPAKTAKGASDGFWAAHYVGGQNGSKGGICAAAVNAIHIRCGPIRTYDPNKPLNWKPLILSIVPFTEGESANDGDIVVSSPGGSEIFNKWSPYLGNPVYALDNSNWVTIDTYFENPVRTAPKQILIDVRRPAKRVISIEFENWIKGDLIKGVVMEDYGGIYVEDENGEKTKVAKVIQRVSSTGRFEGSEYAEIGQVRASHPGVLEMSTTMWRGKVENENLRGGIQIIPANHAKFLNWNLNLRYFIGGKSWMIIAPLNSDPDMLNDRRYTIDGKLTYDSLEGMSPIFNSYIRPYFDENDYESSFRFFVSEDFGRNWRQPPEIEGLPPEGEESPVSHWTNIRLMLGR